MKNVILWSYIVMIFIYPIILTKIILDVVESRVDKILSTYDITIE
jgi:hypothetical protein